MRLEREGLVVIVPRRWTQVRTVEPQEFKATLALRFGIETIVVCELARRKPHQTDLSDLKRICGEMNSIASREAELSDTEKTTFVDLDVQFHTQMAILAGYGPAVDFLRNAGNITCLFSNQLKRMQIISDPDTKFLNDIVKEHSAILLAIESRDPLEARKSLHKHLCSAGRRWQTSVESASMSYLEDDVPSYFKDFPTMIL
jgi:DNA-binding GntR family transcriptional regulator